MTCTERVGVSTSLELLAVQPWRSRVASVVNSRFARPRWPRLFQQQRYVEALEEAQSAEAELLPQQPRLFMDSSGSTGVEVFCSR